MAWAEKLPSGHYRGVYRDGQGRRRSAGVFPHKAKAERAGAAAEEKARKSIWADLDASKRTWGEWVTEWWPTRLVEPGTASRQESYRDVHLTPRWGEVPLGAIRRHDVKAWAAQLLRTTSRRGVVLSPSTVQRIVHLLSASLTAAVDAEILDANPATRIKLPKGAQAVERYLTRPEFDRIVDELPTLADWLVAQFLVNSGVRWGEMAGLHIARASLDRGVVSIQETYDEKHHRMKAYPKGRRARVVPIPVWLCKALLEVDRPPGPCGVEHTTGRCPGPLLFTTSRGAVMRDTNWSGRVWRPAVERADLDGVRPHDLRHTYASWLLQAGIPLAEVGKLMGHESPMTTQKYAWLADMDTAGVLNALPDAPRLPHIALLPDVPEGETSRSEQRPRQDSNLRPTD